MLKIKDLSLMAISFLSYNIKNYPEKLNQKVNHTSSNLLFQQGFPKFLLNLKYLLTEKLSLIGISLSLILSIQLDVISYLKIPVNGPIYERQAVAINTSPIEFFI